MLLHEHVRGACYVMQLPSHFTHAQLPSTRVRLLCTKDLNAATRIPDYNACALPVATHLMQLKTPVSNHLLAAACGWSRCCSQLVDCAKERDGMCAAFQAVC